MKKIIFVFLAAAFLFAESAYAENVSREAFAELIYPMISGCDGSDAVVSDMEEASSAVLAAVSTGVIKTAADGKFLPNEAVGKFEATESLVRIWEIRLGALPATGLGSVFGEYGSYTERARDVLDAATALGLAVDSVPTDEPISTAEAERLSGKLAEALATMERCGMADNSSCFIDESGITAAPGAGKIYFFKSLNQKPDYSDAELILALYDGGRLVSATCRAYVGLNDRENSILHGSCIIPEEEGEYSLKAFLFDSLGSCRPLGEYSLIR